ncbi:MAG: MFS transporter, partial [Chloroflexota bacterium]
MRHFTIFWFGQVVSMFGTRMTSFAIAIWAWQQTGTVTALSLLLLFSMGPAIIFGPFAGNMVDCYSRKLIIILTDTVAGLATIVVLGLFFMDSLQIWHLYVANFVAGLSGAFQMPATAASITMMVPKEQLGRANGMMSLIYSTSNVAAPLLA